MIFMKNKKLRKAFAMVCSFVMVALLAIPTGGFGITASAASTKTSDGDYFFDFRDGSIVPTNTAGNVDVTYETMNILVGTKNAYRYKDTQHGVEFKAGNSIEIAVTGPTRISVGDCQYSAGTSLTMSSKDGSYTQTVESQKGNYSNNFSVVFTYEGTAATTLVLAFTGSTYVPVIKVESLSKIYDFRPGTIIAGDVNTDITYGSLSIKAGSMNGYGYKDTQHGAVLNAGNTIKLAVSGATKVSFGNCAYSKSASLTLSSADGLYTETLALDKSETTETVFNYTGATPTILSVTFDNTNYLSYIKLNAIFKEVGDNNGVAKDSVSMYNFSDGSVVAQTYLKETPVLATAPVISTDKNLTIKSAGALYWHDKQHGLAIFGGDSFEVKVAGDAIVTFNQCEYGADPAATIVASSTKGKFTTPKSQLLKGTETDGLSQVSFEYTGVATTLVFTIVTPIVGAEMYLHGINVSNLPAVTEIPTLVGNGKTDVWDMGGEQLDTAIYNNMLNADIINSWYPSTVAVGSIGNTIGSFGTNEFFFNPAGYVNMRIRTSNEAVTRYDTRTNVMIGDKSLAGYIYSNNVSPVIYVGVKAYKNDILTVYAGSNGGASTIYCESPSGIIQQAESNVSGVKLTFATSEYGIYKIYSTNEKLVIYRVERTHTQPVLVGGSVVITEASGIATKDYTITFKNKATGEVIESSVVNSKYSVYLNEEFDYDVTLSNANGYVIKSANTIRYAKGSSDHNFDVAIKAVDLAVVTGEIVGLSTEALAKLKLSFINTDMLYVPEFTVSGTTITANLEKGVTYKILAANINDYLLSDITTMSATENKTQNITFALKPTFNVAMNLLNLSTEVATNAIVTFTNINESGYKYTFNMADNNVKLRDGQYKVVVKNTGSASYVQTLTSDLKVNGADVSKSVTFKANTSWDFGVYNANPGIETIGTDKYYLGLKLSAAAVLENKTYLLANAGGTIEIPVKAGNIVNISYCYAAAFTIANGAAAPVSVLCTSGSTTQIDSTQYIATSDGVVTVAATGASYLTSIVVAESVAYKEKVYVGANKEYKTINEALAIISKMPRPNNERVEVVIDPGNYEEMLVINSPNISLVNAAGNKSSIALLNSGVSIASNVVRITSYYGHGYNYYSMNSGCKYDEDILAVNEANGYLTNTNPGSGTTKGSYWNATVVVNGTGFEANGIVFENSFNQYISEKEANDTVVEWATGGKGTRPTTVGDTSVQKRSFVERGAAIAILGDKSVFEGCKFVGRQDTLYGASNIKAVFEKCDILGATDYIFGGIIAVFYQCNLIMNTDSSSSADASYLTAAQQSSGRGYLMYNCNVTSTTPGIDTASAYRSKPGYFGRPWTATTSEVVFYKTTVQTTNDTNNVGKSLIAGLGWTDTLGGASSKMYEYGTIEASGEDNTSARAKWSTILATPTLSDGTAISIAAFLGDWTASLQAKGLVLDLAEDKLLTLNTVVGTEEERIAAAVILNAAVTEAEAVTASIYTSDSYAKVTAAINSAKAIVADVNGNTLFTINTATMTLDNAVAALIKSDADYTELNKAISMAEMFATVSSSYTVDSYAAVTTSLTVAKAVPAGIKIDEQATIDTATELLNNAMKALTKKPDANYTVLNAEIAAAEAVTASIYTTNSYAAVSAALTVAKSITPGLNIDSQGTVDAAAIALKNAVAALVKETVVIIATGDTEAKLVDSTFVIPVGAKLEVDSVVSGTVYDEAKEIISQSSNKLDQFMVFEINLKDSSNVAITQLDGKVSIALPIPVGFNLTKAISVFRVETNGSLTKLDTQIVDGKCVFETNHFSTYIIAELAVAEVIVPGVVVPEVIVPEVVVPGVVVDVVADATVIGGTVNSGDSTPTMFYYVLLMLSLAGTMFVIRAKRKQTQE